LNRIFVIAAAYEKTSAAIVDKILACAAVNWNAIGAVINVIVAAFAKDCR